MRTMLPAIAAVAALGVIVWLLFAEEEPVSGVGDLQAPEAARPEAGPPESVRVAAPKRALTAVDRIDAIPAALLEHIANLGDSWLDDPERLRQMISFDFDPRHPVRMTGEHVLRALREMRGVDTPIRFLRNEDLKKFRSHRFVIDLEPRMEAGLLISHSEFIGFRAVAWKGDVYLVPHGGYREDSDPLPEGEQPALER